MCPFYSFERQIVPQKAFAMQSLFIKLMKNDALLLHGYFPDAIAGILQAPFYISETNGLWEF